MTKKIARFLIISAAYIASHLPLAFAETSDEILIKLQKMEAEITELKAIIKKMNARPDGSIPTKVAPIDEQTSKSNVASTSEIEEDMFKPQAQNVTTSITTSTTTTNPVQDLGQFGITYRSDGYKVDALRFGAYGESTFGGVDSGDGWDNGFDAHRVVLLGTYQISDNIFFNTEIEFEHGGIASEADDKLNGAIEVEQVFIDFRVNDYFTWRSPGVDVVPIGYINLFHEPTQFYSTNRPELYQGLIPSTWFTPSTGAYGKIIDGLYYQVQVSSGLEDTASTGSDDQSGDEYEAGISGSEALSLARAPIGDRSQQSDSLGYTTRISYTPSVIPGLSGSSSFHYTDDTSPRDAFGTNANGSKRPLGKNSTTLFDSELRYRIPMTGLEFRSEYVRVDFSDTNNLKANNDVDPTNNVGDDMYGYSLEAAYHYELTPKGKDHWELVPFYRFSSINLQNSGAQGSDANNPSGAGSVKYHTVGAALFPTPKVVIKADYQLGIDDDNQTSDIKSFLGAVGFFF